MNLTGGKDQHRRLILLITVLAAVLIITLIGVCGLLSGPKTPGSQPATSPSATSTSMPRSPGSSPSRLPSITGSSDPETFARRVAAALFEWDTATGWMPLDYAAVLLGVGDPSGIEQAGLASDVANYLPSRPQWLELRRQATRQHLSIESVVVPQAWEQALKEAQPGQLAPGTHALTIKGTRHRAGVWNGTEVTSEHDVSFTVFIVCAPSYPTCHLLRLSQLNNPLR